MRIIYFDIDTLRADHLGCYGYHRNTTPNIDKIAEKGTIFREAYTSDAPCLPSRASLFTGKFGIHNGIVGHGGTAADLRIMGKERGFIDQRMMNEFWIHKMRQLGYYTVSISPYAERHSAYWFYSGWNEMYNPGKQGHEIADDIYFYAEKWLNKHAEEDDWMLHVNFWDPHTPYRTPESFGEPFKDDPPPSWLTEDIISKHRKSYGPHSAREVHGFKSHRSFKRAFSRIKINEMKSLKDFKSWINGYDTGIRYADYYIGKIIQKLKDSNIFQDTMIIVSADHGENQGELNIYGDHGTADHFTNRVPLIIKWPEKSWKKEYDNFIYTNDMVATILEGLGGIVPESWDGEGFFAEIEKNQLFGRDFLVISQNAWSCQRSVRFDHWILIRTYHTGLKNLPEYMLFDYEKDFHMLNNVAEENPTIVDRGIKLLEKWHKKMMKSSNSKIDPMWTVIQEGGPSHTRGKLKSYLRRLKRTDREEMIKIIREKNESYE
jgi:arylsulfatase A-like enzyme